jgi:pimeloyl-ACP methyl ester carboxylesterase
MRGYADTRWGQVHYRREGDGGKTIVLLHESPLSSKVYEPVLPLLGGRHTAIAFDTPGYGMSDGPRGPAEIPDYAATLLEAIDALGIREFVPVGVHTGASLAVQLAIQASDRVSHVVLSGVPVWPPDERAWYLENWAPDVEVAGDGSHFRWAWERYERIWKGPAQMCHLGAAHLLANLDRYNVGYRAAFRYDPEPDLPSIRCPVLLLTAENDLLIESDRKAVGIFPDARLEVVEGLPGQLPMRVPEIFARKIEEFVSG